MTRSQVLLVEDDASIVRFVTAALEELPIELVACQSTEDAWRLLNALPVALVISDLMLPGGSGLDLLHRMRRSSMPALQVIPVIVVSAGLNADVLRELESAGVFRALLKPVSVATLEACVNEALGGAPRTESPPAAPGPMDERVTHAEQHAIATYFAGDQALFGAYKASCLAQFATDAEMGDAAVLNGDAHALRRVAHNLKSVLLTLGYPEDSELARGLEHSAANQALAAATTAWGPLRERLLILMHSTNVAGPV